jgi:hypothetical protein
MLANPWFGSVFTPALKLCSRSSRRGQSCCHQSKPRAGISASNVGQLKATFSSLCSECEMTLYNVWPLCRKSRMNRHSARHDAIESAVYHTGDALRTARRGTVACTCTLIWSKMHPERLP